MNRPRRHERPPEACEVIDFQEALLDRLPAKTREDLMIEARILVAAFAPAGDADAIRWIAGRLLSGKRDAEMDVVQAHRLGAALRRLARGLQ